MNQRNPDELRDEPLDDEQLDLVVGGLAPIGGSGKMTTPTCGDDESHPAHEGCPGFMMIGRGVLGTMNTANLGTRLP
jgi:hypothetical protein